MSKTPLQIMSKKLSLKDVDILTGETLPIDLVKIIYKYYDDFCPICVNEMSICEMCKKFFCVCQECPQCCCLCLLTTMTVYDDGVYPVNLYEDDYFTCSGHYINCFYHTCFNSNYRSLCHLCLYYKKSM